ncbi:sialidase-3.1 [Anguilla anguilla]|uniref:sialidase-3.1 n=1 Tax=Anguilla anguilla TaxID=7936 RepID=UPI0015AA384B|nr:sialidase-3.1 [Anguilla anguilla]XP_035287742.1 sialidase-3.1 [Anguilla anguilla]
MGNTTSRRSSNRIAMEPKKTTVFKQEQTRGITYRIPALIYLREAKTYLAFAEKRSTPRDSDAKLIVMRKGTLLNGSIQWSSPQELSSAGLPDHRTMNPCPVYERISKTLFLFFICVKGGATEHHQIVTGKNAARLCYVSSKDDGLTWSKAKDLTDSVIGKKVRNWATFAVGPGHGVQTEGGRLVVPAYVYYIHCKCACLPFPCSVKPHALTFYSDDRGDTWNVGRIVQRKSCECQMAEIIDRDGRSHLYCNARNTGGHRVEALSETSGSAFDRPCLAPRLVEQRSGGCQGSVIGFPVPESLAEDQVGANRDDINLPYSSDAQTWLLFSHPTSRGKRSDLGVYLNRSPLHTLGWEKPWIINHGPSGYSDLAHCEGEQFACLVECGKESELEEIALVDFHLSDVLDAINGKLHSP